MIETSIHIKKSKDDLTKTRLDHLCKSHIKLMNTLYGVELNGLRLKSILERYDYDRVVHVDQQCRSSEMISVWKCKKLTIA